MKIVLRYIIFTCLIGAASGTGLAQVKTDTLSEKQAIKLQKKFDKELRKTQKISSFKVLPLVYYTPETRMAFGLAGKYSFKFNKADTLLKFSEILPSAVYTLNKQVMLAIGFKLNYNRYWFSTGNIGYYIYPYFFAGIGNDHNAIDVEWYGAKYPVFEMDLYRNVFVNNLFFGVKYRYQNTQIDSVLNGGILETENVSGSSGSTESSLGLGVIYNSKNFDFSPTKGWYIELSTMGTNTGVGASYSDQVVNMDVRRYVPIFKKKDVLAFQVYGEFHTGDVPFNLMPLLGGSKRMRGYREGVFRDRQMMVYQAEYRSRMFFKHFGFTVFGSVGGVGDEIYHVNRNYRYTYGAGLRIAPIAEQRYYIRIDYGRGIDTQGLYIEIGEAF